MRIVYFGSHENAIPALEEIKALRRHKLELVISQPPKKQGRKLQEEDTPLAQAAQFMGLPLYTPKDVNTPEAIARIAAIAPDLIVTASYGAFLGRELRKLPVYGAINLHPSLLPKYRGASPIRAALLAGDKVSGNSIFSMSAKMDAGDILMQEELPILEGENYSSLSTRLANAMAMLLPKVLDNIASIQPIKQDESQASYSKMVHKEDYLLDFSIDSEALVRHIRAYSYVPGAYTIFRGKELKILAAEPYDVPVGRQAGEIVELLKGRGIVVATGSGGILITQVQAAGKKQMNAFDFSLGARFNPHERINQ
ncbi:MAG: methionyl-tRNA formyltransferase [Candidatus Cloacimonadaceae bacterium]